MINHNVFWQWGLLVLSSVLVFYTLPKQAAIPALIVIVLGGLIFIETKNPGSPIGTWLRNIK